MEEDKIKIFVFSQQPLYRSGIAQAISEAEDIEIIGQANVTDKVLLTLEVLPPDIAIIDADNPEDSSLTLVNSLKRLLPKISIIIITSKPSDDQLFDALASQASAYLKKEITGDELVDIIRRVHRGEQPISENLVSSPHIVSKIMQQFQVISSEHEDDNLVSPLTNREIEILNYVAQGLANKQIASKINISEQTIKNHLTSIMAKLNANARTQAVVIAAKKGLISID